MFDFLPLLAYFHPIQTCNNQTTNNNVSMIYKLFTRKENMHYAFIKKIKSINKQVTYIKTKHIY